MVLSICCVSGAGILGCSKGDMTPASLEGELFLDGPDEVRTPVSCGSDLAREFEELIATGVPTPDMKHQGAGALTIVYVDGGRKRVEITQAGTVRIEGRAIQIDRAVLMDLLQRIQRDCAKP
ncbi:MAG: hypothetical protein WD069_10205 [Planctomycetales bacterium]